MLTALVLAQVTAIVGARVHTLEPGQAAREATVLIEGARIAAVGADVAVPEGAAIVDGRGLDLVPSLIDGLAYHDPEHDVLYTAAGVGIVRDHGNELGRIFAARELARSREHLGPALSIAGAVIDGTPPATAAALIARDAAAARDLVERLSAEKIDFVAFQSNLGLDAWRALCTAADERELQVWGPIPKAASLDLALRAGQSGVLFLDALLPEGKRWEDAAPEDFSAAIERVAEAGVALVPLLRGHAHLIEDPGDSAAELLLLSPRYAEFWKRELARRRESLTAESRERGERALGVQRAVLRALDAAGATLVPGSGAPHPWLMPGHGLVRELSAWQAAGMPAARVLACATSGAARALGLDAERGTIAPGKVADLVLVRGDPSADVAALAAVDTVVARGRVLDRRALDAALLDLAARQAAARAAAQAPIAVEAPPLPEGDVLLSGRVETISPAGTVAAERWAVVREPDGVLAFCGRRAVPGGAAQGDLTVDVTQRVSQGKLDSFAVDVRSAGHELSVRGVFTAEQWRIERRADGAFVDNRAAKERIAAVDTGSATTFMLLAHTRGAGAFPVLRFDEGLELEVVRWDLALDDDGDHAFRTPQGLKLAGFMENGALKAVVEQRGQSGMQTTSMEIDAHGGAGLPLPADKLALMRAKSAAPAEPRKDG